MNKKLTTAFLLTLLALMTQGVVAQDAPAPKRPMAAYEVVDVTMEFGGGTLAEFVDALRVEQPKANIVLATMARDVKVPAVSLKGAGLTQALEACCLSAEGDYQVRVRQFVGIGEPVYSIVAEVDRRNRSVAASRSAVTNDSREMHSVYSLSELTMARASGVAPFDAKTILSVIELAMAPLKGSPTMRFHKESGLLLLSAGAHQHGLVDRALHALTQDMKNRERLGLVNAQPAKAAKPPKTVK